MDSQQKSSYTGGPPELETPSEVTDYTSELTGLPPVPEQKPEETAPPPTREVSEAPSVPAALQQQLTTLAQQGVTMPRIRVIEDGKETVGELDVGLITMVTQLAELGQLNKIRKSLQREQFQGKLLSVTLSATDEYKALDLTKQYPFTPWATATFVNDGDDTAYVAINNQRPYHELKKGESIPADFTKADVRIYFIEYYCDSGETATIRVLGKY